VLLPYSKAEHRNHLCMLYEWPLPWILATIMSLSCHLWGFTEQAPPDCIWWTCWFGRKHRRRYKFEGIAILSAMILHISSETWSLAWELGVMKAFLVYGQIESTWNVNIAWTWANLAAETFSLCLWGLFHLINDWNTTTVGVEVTYFCDRVNVQMMYSHLIWIHAPTKGAEQ
jgi:hypothetical protein